MAAASEPVAAALLPSALATAGRKHKRSSDELDTAPKRVRFAEASLGVNGSLESSADSPAPVLDPTITLDLFSKFVVNALDERAAGRSVHYDELRRKFRADPRITDSSGEEPPSSNELRMTLHALTGVVSRLGDNCKQLVTDIVGCKWVGRDQMFVGEYVRFLGNLVSAHANYMSEVTKMLVENFGYLSSSEGQIHGYETVPRKLMYERVHYALQFILDLVPTAAVSTLWPHLTENYPHRMEKKGEHTAYLTNILRVIDYVPALRQRILALVTERTIRIDVEVQGYLEDLDDDEVLQLETEVQDDYDAEDDAASIVSDDSDLSDDEDDDPLPGTSTSLQTIRETADKLDSLLSILLDYYSRSFPDEPTPEPSASATTTFEMLHHFFTTTILPTHRSRFTQFLLFWAAQKSPHFSDRFCVSLIDKAFDNARTMRQRTQAAAYLASYVARAKLMPTNDIRIIVRVLCRWLGEFIDQRSIECTGPDAARWSGFYAVAQAVMYIFCFRHRQLKELDPELDDEEIDEDGINPPASALSATATPIIGGRWTPGLDIMNKVITSKFNPLLVCSKHVVDMFAKVASDNEFLFCWSILDQNKRRGTLMRTGSRTSLPGSGASTPTTTTSSGNSGALGNMMVFKGMTNGGSGTLDAFFPFDPPHMLPKTKRWVDDMLVEWNDDEEEEEDDDEDDEEEDEDDVVGNGAEDDEDDGTESDDD